MQAISKQRGKPATEKMFLSFKFQVLRVKITGIFSIEKVNNLYQLELYNNQTLFLKQ